MDWNRAKTALAARYQVTRKPPPLKVQKKMPRPGFVISMCYRLWPIVESDIIAPNSGARSAERER